MKSERGGAGNAAYPELGCFNGVVDEVRCSVAELWTGYSGLRCCEARASSTEQW
jgi:hypothetical protein